MNATTFYPELKMEPRLAELTRSLQARQQPGHEFLKFAWLLCKHGGDLQSAAEESKRFNPVAPNVERVLMAAVAAGTTTDAGWASELSAYRGLTSDWIHSTVQLTVLGKLKYVRVPLLKRVITQTSEFSAAWIQAGSPIPFSRGTLTAPAMLQEKKVAAIAAFTDELFESWSPAVQANFEDSIRRAVVYASDFQLLDPSVTETAARPASLTNGIAPTPSTGSTAAQALADFNSMLGSLLVTKAADPASVLIVMCPSSALFLSQLLTVGSTFAFPNLNAATGGNIFGFPVALTTAAAQVGSPSSNFIVGIDGSRVLVYDDELVTAEASNVASLQFTDAPAAGPANTVSLFQTASRALRLTRFLNYQRATANACAWFPTQY